MLQTDDGQPTTLPHRSGVHGHHRRAGWRSCLPGRSARSAAAHLVAAAGNARGDRARHRAARARAVVATAAAGNPPRTRRHDISGAGHGTPADCAAQRRRAERSQATDRVRDSYELGGHLDDGDAQHRRGSGLAPVTSPAPASAKAGARPERTVSRNRAVRDPGRQASNPLLHGLDAVSTSSGTTRRQALLPARSL